MTEQSKTANEDLDRARDYVRSVADYLDQMPDVMLLGRWSASRGNLAAELRDAIDAIQNVAPKLLDLLTLPAEPPVGTTIHIEGGNSDGQVWEHVHVGLTPDSTRHWLRRGVSRSDWARWSGLWWRLTEDDGDGQVGLRIIPAPAEVGDTITTAAQLKALPKQAVIRIAERGAVLTSPDGGWRYGNDLMDDREVRDLVEKHGARVLDLPDGGST